MTTPVVEPRIYVLGNDILGMIKIGFSRNPDKRIAQLRREYNLKLEFFYVSPPISTVRKTLDVEKGLHQALDDFRITGEWFSIYAYQFVDWEGITPESLEEFREKDPFYLYHPLHGQMAGSQKFFRERYGIPNRILDQLNDGRRKFYKQWRSLV